MYAKEQKAAYKVLKKERERNYKESSDQKDSLKKLVSALEGKCRIGEKEQCMHTEGDTVWYGLFFCSMLQLVQRQREQKKGRKK